MSDCLIATRTVLDAKKKQLGGRKDLCLSSQSSFYPESLENSASRLTESNEMKQVRLEQ